VLEYLLSASHLIVAARKGQGSSKLAEVSAREPQLAAGRILFLDFPADLGERSATEVRERIGAGLGISGLVPSAVESYIQANRLYSAA
jgi:nicotinic acid mononucleotide adenylyltransferase